MLVRAAQAVAQIMSNMVVEARRSVRHTHRPAHALLRAVRSVAASSSLPGNALRITTRSSITIIVEQSRWMPRACHARRAWLSRSSGSRWRAPCGRLAMRPPVASGRSFCQTTTDDARHEARLSSSVVPGDGETQRALARALRRSCAPERCVECRAVGLLRVPPGLSLLPACWT